jgi:hypothetical protein
MLWVLLQERSEGRIDAPKPTLQQHRHIEDRRNVPLPRRDPSA